MDDSPSSSSGAHSGERPSRVPLARATAATIEPGTDLAGWAHYLGPPAPEDPRVRLLARCGGILAAAALVGYLTWRVTTTLPADGWDRVAAWALICFEALALPGLLLRLITLWDIDSRAPSPVGETPGDRRVALLIPTYDEPAEVVAPTIAAACAIEPAHETWVLDDGDRDWLEQMCRRYGARYVRRPVHDHAKAGNINHALDLMRHEEAGGAAEIDVIAVVDCDHVPLPHFLTSTLAWFDDPGVALVQGPQSFYNAGAFDDDRATGEQGLFFHVLMPSRNHVGAGPFWCGSTALLRARALHEVGGVATDTIIEDMHTTLHLIRAGWRTVYHHQTLAVGLAPATPAQYLLQRRRWGLGAMQVLAKERLWAAKRWLSWRNYYEYLSGTLWWLEGVATVIAFAIPAAILLSGARTSTAGPLLFATVFVTMFALRMWGVRRLLRHHLHVPTAFALRIFRIPVGISCLWWLLTRRTLAFDVTPKGASERRVRGRVPAALTVVLVAVLAVLGYAGAGLAGAVPWHATPGAAVASGAWLVVAAVVLVSGIRRITSPAYATSRRSAYRISVRADVTVDGVPGRLLDVSVGGAAVELREDVPPHDAELDLLLPGAQPVRMRVVRTSAAATHRHVVSLRVRDEDWDAYRRLSLWLFHTPPGAVGHIPPSVPVAAATTWTRDTPTLAALAGPTTTVSRAR